MNNEEVKKLREEVAALMSELPMNELMQAYGFALGLLAKENAA